MRSSSVTGHSWLLRRPFKSQHLHFQLLPRNGGEDDDDDDDNCDGDDDDHGDDYDNDDDGDGDGFSESGDDNYLISYCLPLTQTR